MRRAEQSRNALIDYLSTALPIRYQGAMPLRASERFHIALDWVDSELIQDARHTPWKVTGRVSFGVSGELTNPARALPGSMGGSSLLSPA